VGPVLTPEKTEAGAVNPNTELQVGEKGLHPSFFTLQSMSPCTTPQCLPGSLYEEGPVSKRVIHPGHT
jgi:hypothetical protein